jgi:NitT/TauT family transport system ATP-binding protein
MTPRPGRLAADIPIPLPRPRPAGTASDPVAAAIEAEIRAALASVHAPELAGWAEPNGVAAA